MGYEYIVFDFGNTFADLRAGYQSTFSAVFEKFNMDYDPAKVSEYADVSLDKLFADYHTGCTCRYRDFVTMTLATYERNMFTSARLYGDAPDTLRFLMADGRRMGIVSRSYEEHIRRILSQFRIEDMFCSIVGQDRAIMERPNPYSIELCMREMGAEKHSTLVVSSSPLDIETGKNAGVATALLDRDGSIDDSCGPDYKLHSLLELLRL